MMLARSTRSTAGMLCETAEVARSTRAGAMVRESAGFARVALPSAGTGWRAVPSGALANVINEVTPIDADYIISPLLDGDQGPACMALNTPLPAGSYTVHVRADQVGTGRQVRVSLRDVANNVVGVSAWQAVTGTLTTYDLSVTTTATATSVRIEAQ